MYGEVTVLWPVRFQCAGRRKKTSLRTNSPGEFDSRIDSNAGKGHVERDGDSEEEVHLMVARYCILGRKDGSTGKGLGVSFMVNSATTFPRRWDRMFVQGGSVVSRGRLRNHNTFYKERYDMGARDTSFPLSRLSLSVLPKGKLAAANGRKGNGKKSKEERTYNQTVYSEEMTRPPKSDPKRNYTVQYPSGKYQSLDYPGENPVKTRREVNFLPIYV